MTQAFNFVLMILKSRQRGLLLQPLWATESFNYFSNLLGAEGFLVSLQALLSKNLLTCLVLILLAKLLSKDSMWEGSREGGGALRGSQLQFCLLPLHFFAVRLCSGFQQGLEALNVSLVDKAGEQ